MFLIVGPSGKLALSKTGGFLSKAEILGPGGGGLFPPFNESLNRLLHRNFLPAREARQAPLTSESRWAWLGLNFGSRPRPASIAATH